MKKVSVIVCYNNIEKFKDFMNSLNSQSYIDNIEIIEIDNRENKFKSAASALNFGAEKAKGEILIFSHQDIVFLDNETIAKFVDFISKFDAAIVGVAGYSIDKKEKISTIVHGINKYRVSDCDEFNYISCETVDECFFGFKKDLWNKFKFDEIICDNWHLYAVEYALRIRLNGYKCVVVPASIWHKSTGEINSSFYKGVKQIIKRYKKSYKYLYTTCVQIRNTNTGLFQFRLRKKVGKIFYKFVKK